MESNPKIFKFRQIIYQNEAVGALITGRWVTRPQIGGYLGSFGLGRREWSTNYLERSERLRRRNQSTNGRERSESLGREIGPPITSSEARGLEEETSPPMAASEARV